MQVLNWSARLSLKQESPVHTRNKCSIKQGSCTHSNAGCDNRISSTYKSMYGIIQIPGEIHIISNKKCMARMTNQNMTLRDKARLEQEEDIKHHVCSIKLSSEVCIKKKKKIWAISKFLYKIAITCNKFCFPQLQWRLATFSWCIFLSQDNLTNELPPNFYIEMYERDV